MAEKRIGRNVDTGVCTLTRIVVLPYKGIQEFSYPFGQDKSRGGQKRRISRRNGCVTVPNKLEGATQISFQIYKKDICGRQGDISDWEDILNFATAYHHGFCMAGKTWSICKAKVT